MNYRMEISESMWRATLSGSLTKSDLLELAKGVRALWEVDSIAPLNGLIDVRSPSNIDFDYFTVHTIVSEAQRKSLRNVAKIAFFVESPLQYGFARMFQTLLNQTELRLRIYESENDALSWIMKGGDL